MTQGNVGASCPTHAWVTHCSKIIWCVKLHAAGTLMPVRPVIVMTAEASLPSGSALVLS